MVIGVDAGALSVSDERLKVGVYRVIRNLFQELSTLDSINRYRLYSFDPIDPDTLRLFSDAFENIVLTPQKAWFTLRLPLSLFVHPVDIFLGVSQAVPLFAGKSISFVYDLGFLHFPDKYPGSYKKLRLQTERAVHRSKHIITISEASKADIVEEYHCSADKVTVCYPGVDPRFSLHGQSFTCTHPYFLHVGSLKPGKNIPNLIRSYAAFRKNVSQDYMLLLVGGDYWFDDDIMKTIKTEEMDEYVRILGHVPDSLLPEYYRGATAFVTTSLWEGFCLPVMEAMRSGCPVIAPKIASFPEIVAEEQLLFSKNDPVSVCAMMKKVIEGEELRKVAIAKGVAKSERYDWKQFAQNVLSVIESVGNG